MTGGTRRVSFYVRASPPTAYYPDGWPQEVLEADYEPHEFEIMHRLAQRAVAAPSGSEERTVAVGELCTLHELKVLFPGSRLLTTEEEVEAGYRSQFQIPERARPAQQSLLDERRPDGGQLDPF